MLEYQLGLYEKSMPGSLSLREKLQETKDAGFDYMELSVDETDEKLARLKWSKEEVKSLVRDMWNTGVPVKSICLSGHRKYPLGHPDKEVQAHSLAIMQDAIVLASRLGVRIIQLAGYDVYYEVGSVQTREVFGENLYKSTLLAAREGVTLAFETMETPFMDTVGKAMDWVNKVNSPYLQVYPDIGNITNASLVCKTDVLADLRSGIGHISAVHLKETVPGVYREVPYGTGHVDFKGSVVTALELGVRMFVGEFWYTGEKDWRGILKRNNEFLRAAF